MKIILGLICYVFFHAPSYTDGAENKSPSYKYLAFLPFPSKSHHRVFEPLLRELALRGHQVTVVTPLPTDEKIPNYRQIVMKNYNPDLVEAMEKNAGTSDYRQILKMRWIIHQVFLFMMRSMGIILANFTFNDPTVKKLLESNEKYDGLIVEASFMQEINLALAHKFDAVTIEVLTAGNYHWAYWLYGNPYDTSYIPDMSTPYADQMTFLERLHNTINSLLVRGFYALYFMPVYEDLMNKLIRYDGWETRPPLMDMLRNVSLVLVNTHVSLNDPYPMSPNFKEVGGINIKPTKKLNQELQDFMDGAKDGVIYFSFGSNFNFSKLSDKDEVNGLVNLFGSLKQRVLWKYDQPITDLPKNLKISNWFPQQEILAHKNCKLFITHGGFLSMTEATYYGIPMIGTPILGDQLKNVKQLETKGHGISLDFFNITETSMKWAINEILNNPTYAENAMKISELFRDKPETALETAVYWTEYVIRHNGAHHLKPAISTMPWYQQAMIDVYATIAAIILIPLYIMYRIIKCLITCICCRKSSRTKYDKIKKNK